jgi:hypothetical protein
MINKELFDFVKIKPLLRSVDMSASRFTQKLHQYNIRGQIQGFTDEEKTQIKSSLLVIAAIIKDEAEKI